MNTHPLKSLAVAVACACLMPLTSRAIAIDLPFSIALGRVAPGPTPANAAQDTAAANAIIDRINTGLSTSSYDVVGYTYDVINDPGTLPLAVYAGSGSTTSGDQEIDLGAGGYKYLSVKYGGDDGSLVFWDISGLTDKHYVPAEWEAGDHKKANNYNLFNPSTQPPQQVDPVPDGGGTVVFLGIALSGLSLAWADERVR